jgi:hypothetical protein
LARWISAKGEGGVSKPEEVDFSYEMGEELSGPEISLGVLSPEELRKLHFVVAREHPELAYVLREGGLIESDEPLDDVLGPVYGMATRKLLQGDLEKQYAVHFAALEAEKEAYFTPFQSKPSGPLQAADAVMIWMGYEPRLDVDLPAWARANFANSALAEDFLLRFEAVSTRFERLIEPEEFVLWAVWQSQSWRSWRQISAHDLARLHAELKDRDRRIKRLESDVAVRKRRLEEAHAKLSEQQDDGTDRLRAAVTLLALLFFKADKSRAPRLRTADLGAYLSQHISLPPHVLKNWLKRGAKALGVELEQIDDDKLPPLPPTYENRGSPLRPPRRTKS